MRVSFIVPSTDEFLILFNNDIRGKGGGLEDISIYTPSSSSARGSGLFSLLAGIARKSLPFLMKTVLPEGLDMAKNVLSDVNSGSRFKKSLKRRGLKSLGNIGRKIVGGGGGRKKRGRGVTKKKTNNTKLKKRLRVYKDVFSDI